MKDTKVLSAFIMLIFLLLSVENGISQGTNFTVNQKGHIFLRLCAGPDQTNVQFTVSDDFANKSLSSNSLFSETIEIGYTFSKYFGISSGFGLSKYKAVFGLDTYTNSYDTVDSEMETYNRRISANDFSEKQSISFLNIPLLFNAKIPFTKSFGVFINTGMFFSIPVKSSYSSSGTFSYTGYYPAYNVLFTDIPYEGFKSNVQSVDDGELKLKKLVPEFYSIAGLYVSLHEKLQIGIGVSYDKVLSNISNYPSSEKFNLSPIENKNNSIMQGFNKVSANSIGLKLSITIYL